MGTRHLIAIVKDNDYKLAQYGQWDGYPNGQGLTILRFLQNDFNKEQLLKKLDNVSFITEEEIKERWAECGADPDAGFVPWKIAEAFGEKYPENSRDTGAKILSIIQHENRPIKVTNSLDFAGDSLFCEWAYVIDFDKNTFEVYSGFNKKPIDSTERFSFLQTEESEYYPISLYESFDLSKLPSEEEFLKKYKEDDE